VNRKKRYSAISQSKTEPMLLQCLSWTMLIISSKKIVAIIFWLASPDTFW